MATLQEVLDKLDAAEADLAGVIAAEHDRVIEELKTLQSGGGANKMSELDSLKTRYQSALTEDWRQMDDTLRNEVDPLLKEGLDRYFYDRIETGGFLRAVLENDLQKAIGLAHPLMPLRQMKALVTAIYTYAPAEAWGSQQAVDNWLAGRNDGFIP